jgi:cell wall-associated NlpC family hydrolase
VEAAPATLPSPRRRRRALIALPVLACTAAAAAAFTQLAGGQSGKDDTPAAVPAAKPAAAKPVPKAPQPPPLRSRPKVVVAVPPGEAPPANAATGPGAAASQPASDDEVRNELADFREHLNSGAGAQTGPVPRVLKNGTAVAPDRAPARVVAVIAAANEIATTPYKWGGGHGAWRDRGYDCSGSVSFALAGAGLLQAPLNSSGFLKYGEPGPGKWITIYTNHGHIFMVVAGLRFDTSGARGGTRWQPTGRSTAGFTVRHPPGL